MNSTSCFWLPNPNGTQDIVFDDARDVLLIAKAHYILNCPLEEAKQLFRETSPDMDAGKKMMDSLFEEVEKIHNMSFWLTGLLYAIRYIQADKLGIIFTEKKKVESDDPPCQTPIV